MQCAVLKWRMVLYSCYAMCDAEMAYGATLILYAMRGTEMRMAGAALMEHGSGEADRKSGVRSSVCGGERCSMPRCLQRARFQSREQGEIKHKNAHARYELYGVEGVFGFDLAASQAGNGCTCTVGPPATQILTTKFNK
eukprot:3585058-Rhodomonas_salina.1